MNNFKKDFKLLKVLLENGDVNTDKVFIAGGCLRDVLKEEKYKDIDLYCQDEETLENVKNSLGRDNVVSQFAITFKIQGISVPVQLINLLIGNPKDVIEQFDFTINQRYLKMSSLGETKDIISSNPNDWTLRLGKKVKTPNSLLARFLKLLSKDYKIEKTEVLKLLEIVKSWVESQDKNYFSSKDFLLKYGTEND